MEERAETGDFVVPGDFLSTTEEFVPGEGVYEEDNGVYSSVTGVVLKDADTKKVTVHSKTDTPPVLKQGDIVIGRIARIRGQIASIDIAAIRGKEDREAFFSEDAIIHISKITDDYVEEIEDKLSPADIIRARVISAEKESVELSIVDDSLGVLLAYCSKCRTILEKEDDHLKCPNCGNVESRKITNDYRQGIL